MFEKDFFKLMSNSVFGKTMENIRDHKDMKLVTSREKYVKYVMKPNFKDGHPFSKHLFAIEMGKTEIKMNKDFCRDMTKDVEKRFDTSGYSKDENRPLPIRENKKVIGLMKDELGGKIMTAFVALRSKMYAYRR